MIKYPSNRMVGLNPSNPMGSPALKKKDYNPYNHTDACRHTRWTAKECYQFMSARPWQKVNDFYSYMVKGCISLSELFGKETITMSLKQELLVVFGCITPKLEELDQSLVDNERAALGSATLS
ncbi:uncharacterized protein LOC111369797 isoform X2 [Olea europaea var. sylvestris]|uniref:uncharacterized protein LOC111369797 isoform X2 n=1 Tax=Olea europaea var. sylvestris TaxID=158386 RepID=UPI000C1D622F|nr:uncharacterized protein LOC111369797 isoform X2 [Olea europaea var. sylvestris]